MPRAGGENHSKQPSSLLDIKRLKTGVVMGSGGTGHAGELTEQKHPQKHPDTHITLLTVA